MADSIPRAYLKEIMETLVGESLKVALFVNLTGYNELTASTYAVLAGTATEVTGAGYTTGGVALTGEASSNLATNGAKFTASATAIVSSNYTCRYAVIYNSTSPGNIRFIKDLGADKTISGGTLTITWSAVNGIVNISFTA